MIENDPDLEEALRGAPADLWRQLFEAARGYLAEPEHASWAGGQQIDTTVVDGAERPVFQMPYAVYSENVGRIVALMNEIGVVFPFDWSGWDGVERYRGRTALRTTSVSADSREANSTLVSRTRSGGCVLPTRGRRLRGCRLGGGPGSRCAV